MAAAPSAWIRIGTEGLAWARRGADGTLEATGRAPEWGGLPLEDGTRVGLVVPGSRVRVHAVDLPPASRRRLHAALPFALEDRLPGDPEHYHLVPLPRRGRHRPLPVAVVEHAAMQEWLGSAREAGLRPQWLLPDYFCLPEPDAGTWRVVAGEDPLPLRLPGAFGLAAPAGAGGLPAGLLLALEEAAELPETLELLVPDPDTRQAVQEWVERLQGWGLTVQVQEMARDPETWLLGQPPPAKALSLLTGPYAAREDYRLWLRRAGPAAGLAAGVLLTLAVGTWQELGDVQAEHRALQERIRETYREAFPGGGNLVDPRFQMAQRLERLRGEQGEGGGPEGLLGRLVAVAPELEKASGTRVSRLTFREGRLEMTLSVPDFEALESLKGRLGPDGAHLEEAELQGERVRARLITGEERP